MQVRRVRRSTGTATDTTTNAASVPMLTRFARSVSGTKPASRATTAVVSAVMTYGVPQRGWTAASRAGSSPSRPIAKPIRPIATMSTRITLVSPATAATEISVAARPTPTVSNASAIGALSSIAP